MASPFVLNNMDLQYANIPSQTFQCYVAFLNPLSITTTWNDLSQDNTGNWLPPANVDTAAKHIQPYIPTVNLGSNRIGFANEPLYFDGSRSSQRHDVPVVSYAWVISGPASSTYYQNKSQCAITWTTPGLYTVKLTVTDIAGHPNTGVRQVMIYQDRSSALPGVISVSGLSGSLSSSGWQCQLTTINSQVTLFPPDALAVGTYQPVVILIETSYEVIPDYWVNKTVGPYGEFSPGYPYMDPRIFFDGYIQSGTIHQDVDKDTLAFSCAGPQMILQESQTHQIGYYNTTINKIVNQAPASLKPATAGQGFLVDGLMVADIIHSLLQYHCSLGQYHDIHCWNANIPTKAFNITSKTAYYNLTYTSLSINEGNIWSNMQSLCANEWSSIYCERDGSIRVGPQINYRGNEYWSQPTLLGATVAASLINLASDLGVAINSSDIDTVGDDIGDLPATPMPLRVVHPWGHTFAEMPAAVPFQTDISPEMIIAQKGLQGPPILCVFSDTPTLDVGQLPPTQIPLYPWTTAAWPQDLSIYPIYYEFPENYTGRTSLVKIIGTLVNASNIWSAWYPQNSFGVTNKGNGTNILATLPAGNWQVTDSYVLPDITSKQNKQLVSNYWWEMARRVYYAQNVAYTGTVNLGIFTAANLGDIVAVTRQNNTLGPHWIQKPFSIQGISYDFDMTSKAWSTTLTLTEVTSAFLTPIIKPPAVIPNY